MSARSVWGALSIVLLACGGSAALDSAGGSGGTAGTAAAGGVGGSGADGGGGAGASGGAAHVQPECQAREDCHLVNSCCDCASVPLDVELPCRGEECFAPLCAAFEAVEAECRLGRCVTSVDCEIAKVACDQQPPQCPAGQTPTVEGACYGGCFPAVDCSAVSYCEQCGPGQACVAEVAQTGPVYHCIEMPAECNGAPSCECMGDTVCVGAFDQCIDANNGTLECQCSTC